MTHHSAVKRSRLAVTRSAPLPVSGMVIGMETEEAAALLPRVFNLCRVAQSIAARLAFGLPVAPSHHEELRREVLREHLIKFCLKFPGHFGAGPQPMPERWQQGGPAARRALFGSEERLPEDAQAFDAFLESGQGVAPILRRIRDCFAPLEAASTKLPAVTPETALSAVALENSVAARQEDRPAMRHIESRFGRGPLWRAAARAFDAQDCLDGCLPRCATPAPGVAVVPAARGAYAVSATAEAGRVMAFRRITPTDHLMARGGILDQMLASLPAHKSGMAPLILDILDPCSPVQIKEVAHA